MEILKCVDNETKHENSNQIISEIFCHIKGITQRTKTNLPLGGESWAQDEKSYENAFANGIKVLNVIGIQPLIENGLLKGITLTLVSACKETTLSSSVEEKYIEDLGNLKMVDSIQRVSNQLNKNLSDGTRIQFEWKGVTYETKIERSGKISTLSALARNACRTYKDEKASINIYRHIKARYLDNAGWHPLDDLRKG